MISEDHDDFKESVQINIFIAGMLMIFGKKNFLQSWSAGILFRHSIIIYESESELFTGDTSKDNHSPGPVFREVSP